jgi:hypothetical protein
MIRLAILIVFCTSLSVSAQTDTLQTITNDPLIVEKTDTIPIKSYATRYDPRKALLYAAILPGLGQVYTKKYWKLPLVYGGMGFIGYYIDVYEKGYTKYKLQLFQVIDGNQHASLYSESQLRTVVNRYRRERDFMIILMGGVYLLQIIDAHVDAHLKEFDLNPNLQVRLEPMIDNDPMIGRQAGFSVFLKF